MQKKENKKNKKNKKKSGAPRRRRHRDDVPVSRGVFGVALAAAGVSRQAIALEQTARELGGVDLREDREAAFAAWCLSK